MSAKPFIRVYTLLFCLSSCEPHIFVALKNHTNTDKEIKVIYPPGFKFGGEERFDFTISDSIKTYALDEPTNSANAIIIPFRSSDTIARTYSFILKSNRKAIVEDRGFTAAPTYGQIFVIDNVDTVELKKHGKDFGKKPRLLWGGTWSHTIKDNN